MSDETEWLDKAARCRRLARSTLDRQAHAALISMAAELEAKAAEARSDRREFSEIEPRLIRPAG